MTKACVVASLAMFALLGASAVSAAETPGAFSMNDQVREHVRAVRQVALSPDGRRVAAMITDTTADGGQARLWLLAPGAPPRQLTSAKETTDTSSPQWMPDGASILYAARNDGAKALFRLPLDGGEPRRLQLGVSDGKVSGAWDGPKPASVLSVSGFALSPDGKNIALWADDAELPAVKARKDRKDDSYIHRDDGDHDRTHLYMVDPASGAARRLDVAGRFLSARWSFDGADIIVTTDQNSDVTGPDATVWQVKPDGETGSAQIRGHGGHPPRAHAPRLYGSMRR
jgi:Tol biopolymer transport system component